MSDPLPPHGQQPTRLLCPQDSPGRNTGVGCHFLLRNLCLLQANKHLVVLLEVFLMIWGNVNNPKRASQVLLVVQNPPASAGDIEAWVQPLDGEDPL